MFFSQNSDCDLKAQLTDAVATSQLKIDVTYRDNTDEYQPDAIVSTNGTTEVTLLAAPTGSVVNIVESIKIYNPDTQANTVQILAGDDVIASCAVGAGQFVIFSQEGFNSSGYVAANADLSSLTSAGKVVVSSLPMPSNSYIDLTLGASGSTYTAPAEGYVFLCKASSAANQYMVLQNNSAGNLRTQIYNAGSVYIPVKKNDQVYYEYTVVGTTWWFRFVYAQGEV